MCTAHFYKEDFLKILDCKDRESTKKAMSDWINSAYDCGIPQLVNCGKTMQNWLTGILNSFSTSITNGFIEGCNNKIKVLKRNAYATEISNAFVTVFYICFPTNISILQQNKRQFNFLPLVIIIILFFRVTPTIDIEPLNLTIFSITY